MEIFLTCFGFLFIFAMTTLGSAVVIFFKGNISDRVDRMFLGFASGVMVAASIWSLIIPAVDSSQYMGAWSFVPAVVGVVLGSIFLIVLGIVIKVDKEVEMSVDRARCLRLFWAVTIHNIPEGLAVGFAFGFALVEGSMEAYLLALGLAIGIGVQNFPEGAAISLPIKGSTGSRAKGFAYGTLSGVVEPIFALIGYFLATYLVVLQPWLLSFAAGAMLYVVVDDLLPNARDVKQHILPSMSFIVGFIIMMTLDIALG